MGYYDDCLEHHGILGQKWGVRRFESTNGTLTAAGKKRYTTDGNGNYKKVKKTTSADVETSKKKTSNEEETEEKKKGLSDKQKKALIIGAAAVGTAVAAYGGYKLYQLNKEAKQGLSEQYHQKAVNAFSTSNKMDAKGFDLHDQGFKLARSSGADEANKMMNEGVRMMRDAKSLRETGYKLQDKAKAGKFSVKEKVDYLKSKKDTSDMLSAQKKAVTKALKDYNNDRIAWDKKTINLESQKRMAERIGDTAKAAKIDKKLASSPPPIPPQFSKKGVAATNKLASEASSLARSVTAEGPKSFSKPAQNSSAVKQAMTNQKLSATVTSFNAGKKAVNNATKIHGQTKFSQASKANDDYVSQMLKKNKSLSSYSMDDLKKLDLY